MKLKKIPIMDLVLDGHELNLVKDCIKKKMLSFRGEYVKKFEKKFQKFINSDNATSVSNGTTALELALATFGLKKNDEVIIPNFAFAAVINAVLNVGATPVLVDVDEHFWNINISEIKKKFHLRQKQLLLSIIMVFHVIFKILRKLLKIRKFF